MELKDSLKDGTAVIHVSGKVMQPENVTQFKGLVLRYLEEYGARNFIIDLSKVPWMNSQGYRMLLGSFQQVTEKSGTMVLTGCKNLKPEVIVLFLARVFDTYRDEDEAMEHFAAHA